MDNRDQNENRGKKNPEETSKDDGVKKERKKGQKGVAAIRSWLTRLSCTCERKYSHAPPTIGDLYLCPRHGEAIVEKVHEIRETRLTDRMEKQIGEENEEEPYDSLLG